MEMKGPVTLSITIGSSSSMVKSIEFVPVTSASGMFADDPTKANSTPVAGQVNFLVAGLTLPR